MIFLKKIVSYPLSVLFYFALGISLMISHIVQVLTLNLGGYKTHKKSVDYLNFFLLSCLYILGTRIKFINKQKLPENTPLIFVCNHQSVYDVSPIHFFLRKHHPKFVAKKELGKGIPGVSYNLRHGGSVLIDRKNPKESIRIIMGFGKYIEKYKRSAVIFPEGTRSKDGVPKKFSENGFKVIVRNAPSSYAVPITVNNSWKLSSIGAFPMEIGVKIIFEVHEPIKCDSLPFNELFEKVEQTIKNGVIL